MNVEEILEQAKFNLAAAMDVRTSDLNVIVSQPTAKQVCGRKVLGEGLPTYEIWLSYVRLAVIRNEDGRWFMLVMRKEVAERLAQVAALVQLTPFIKNKA